MTSYDVHDCPSPHIIDEAAEWFVEFSTGAPDAEAHRAFDRWLRKSPEHVRAYLEMFPLWEDAPLISRDRMPDADKLIALAQEVDPNIISLKLSATRIGCPRPTRNEGPAFSRAGAHHRWQAFAAAIALIAVGLAATLYFSRNVYSTQIAEQRHITLADGSDVELNARSKIRIRFDERERRIELLSGQALFSVARDSTRPFVVESGDAQVRAIGTQFDVYRKQWGTVVTVVEGRVAVRAGKALETAESAMRAASSAAAPGTGGRRMGRDAILLEAGEQLSVRPESVTAPVKSDLAAVTSWRQRRLVFSATPLPEVAEEFNRYNTRQLRIEGATLDIFKVNAVFSATDLTSLLRFLRAQENISVEETGREIRVSASPLEKSR